MRERRRLIPAQNRTLDTRWKIKTFLAIGAIVLLTWYARRRSLVYTTVHPVTVTFAPASVELALDTVTTGVLYPPTPFKCPDSASFAGKGVFINTWPDSIALQRKIPCGLTGQIAAPPRAQTAQTILGTNVRLSWILGQLPTEQILTGEADKIRFAVFAAPDDSTAGLDWLRVLKEKIDILVLWGGHRQAIITTREMIRPQYCIVLDSLACAGSWCDSLHIIAPPFAEDRVAFIYTNASGVQMIRANETMRKTRIGPSLLRRFLHRSDS